MPVISEMQLFCSMENNMHFQLVTVIHTDLLCTQ